MIKVFYGENRTEATKSIKALLGEDYEVVEGLDLTPDDLPSLFQGLSLFAETRNILIRDFTANKPVYEQLPRFLNTPHNIILFETKLDKRSATYKAIKDQLEFKEFALPPSRNLNLIFDIFKTAKKDGTRAVAMLSQIKTEEDPIMFTGLLVSQAIKDFAARPTGAREQRILKELAATDLAMKSAKVEPWLLVESFLLRMSSLS